MAFNLDTAQKETTEFLGRFACAFLVWQQVEFHIAAIYAGAINPTPYPVPGPLPDVSSACLASALALQFGGKLAMADAAVQSRLGPVGQAEWKRLYGKAKELNVRRNDLAHGGWFINWAHRSSDDPKSIPQYIGQPAGSHRPKRQYGPKQLAELEDQFSAFLLELMHFATAVMIRDGNDLDQ